ncbi:MAG: histone methyltransferase set2 [Bogoriella megaspora]|nr:MAG: histone methyltransferase set2 [Bogoriella megaspora]
MSDNEDDKKSRALESEVRDMHLKPESSPDSDKGGIRTSVDAVKQERTSTNGSPLKFESNSRSTSESPVKPQATMRSPLHEHEDLIGGDITVKVEPGQAPKLSRKSSQKVIHRPPQLFIEHEDKTEEAKKTFHVIADCIYANKYIGTTDPALECDCQEEYDAATSTNHACGEDSDCINRATKMECIGDCGCGTLCQNQRFQNREYAHVAVIKTEKKGYGLRAEKGLHRGDFIFEYIGDVITEATFRRRMIQYDEEGIKHFYFMSLNKGEFVDATKKGNLGRFCNHSCNPNCYVDKWVVGDRLRMGIFAERNIKAGEELVFNYNVDRYGANPQPCYCGEPNCSGFIGGKTQTERATKLSKTVIEALGIDDGDGWDTAVAKKPRKKKTGEDDEEYVNNVQPKALDEDAVTKVVSTLMQCKEKWIAVKLLSRLQRADAEKVRNRVVKMHGYRMLKTVLSTFKDDANVLLQVFDILNGLPRLTRNKIQDSKIEETVQELTTGGDPEFDTVRERARSILEVWGKLELAYRIPRMKRDPNASKEERRPERAERRGSTRERSRSRTKSPSPPRGPSAPSGPRSGVPQRAPGFVGGPSRPPSFRRGPPPLPFGWSEARDKSGRLYFYTTEGHTQWQRPSAPAAAPPPPPPPVVVDPNKQLNDIINSIVSQRDTKPSTPASATPKPEETPQKSSGQSKSEKWRSLPEEKQRKIYENTLAPHVQYVMNKYKGKIPKDDLKRIAKEVSKKLVESDYKHNQVSDPTKISASRELKVKDFCKKFFARAHHKLKEKTKLKEDGQKAISEKFELQKYETSTISGAEKPADIDDTVLSDAEMDPDDEKATPSETPPTQDTSPNDLKRKLEDNNGTTFMNEELNSPVKRVKSETLNAPPPPPPPPVESPPDVVEYEQILMQTDTVPNEEASPSLLGEAMLATAQSPKKEMDIKPLKAEMDATSTIQSDGHVMMKQEPDLSVERNGFKKEEDMEMDGVDSEKLKQLETAA